MRWIFTARKRWTTRPVTFEADHFTFYGGRYDIWLWSADQILVRYIAPSNGREYRLTRLEVGP